MKAIIEHVKTDPNAFKHGLLGCASTAAAAVFVPSLVNIAIASLIMGISIEVIQRIMRELTMSKQNTFEENILDSLGTWLWFLSFYYKVR